MTFPDRTFPFASTIEGKRVRFLRSYEHTLAQVQSRLGVERYGLKISAYREFCHILGAAAFILTSTLVSRALWGTDIALPVLFVAAMIAITYQEFYFHPRHFEQKFSKSVVDWFSWTVPLFLYLFINGI